MFQNDAESTTEKWGLEAGLFKVFTNKDDKGTKTKGQQAKELLTRYGSAYLITSISFAIVSFTLCYALISSGVSPCNIAIGGPSIPDGPSIALFASHCTA